MTEEDVARPDLPSPPPEPVLGGGLGTPPPTGRSNRPTKAAHLMKGRKGQMPNAGPTTLWRPRLVSKALLPARVSPIPVEKAMQVLYPTMHICLSLVQETTARVSEEQEEKAMQVLYPTMHICLSLVQETAARVSEEDNSLDEKKKAIIESDIGLMLHLLHMFGEDEH
ncbi:unnamed protein product, partial [Symbiodinium sp. KB8]